MHRFIPMLIIGQSWRTLHHDTIFCTWNVWLLPSIFDDVVIVKDNNSNPLSYPLSMVRNVFRPRFIANSPKKRKSVRKTIVVAQQFQNKITLFMRWNFACYKLFPSCLIVSKGIRPLRLQTLNLGIGLKGWCMMLGLHVVTMDKPLSGHGKEEVDDYLEKVTGQCH